MTLLRPTTMKHMDRASRKMGKIAIFSLRLKIFITLGTMKCHRLWWLLSCRGCKVCGGSALAFGAEGYDLGGWFGTARFFTGLGMMGRLDRMVKRGTHNALPWHGRCLANSVAKGPKRISKNRSNKRSCNGNPEPVGGSSSEAGKRETQLKIRTERRNGWWLL